MRAEGTTPHCKLWPLDFFWGGGVRCQVKEVSKTVGIGSILGFGVKGTES